MATPPKRNAKSRPQAPKRVVSSRSLQSKAGIKKSTAPTKTFSVQSVATNESGEKMVIYADTGLGKSTLAAMAPNPVFIDLDNGCENLRHPITNEPLMTVPGVETYADVRAALQQPDLFKDFDTVVIDNVTVLQDLAVPYMLETIPKEKGDQARNIIDYGYNKGYQHLYDIMKLVLQDCDALLSKGKNIILIAQASPNKIANPGGDDFLCLGPRLYAGKPSIEALYCEWASHIFHIAYQDVFTHKDDKKKTVAKASGGTSRAIHTQSEIHYRAKTRQLKDGRFLPELIEFTSRDDDSLWNLMFARGGE